MPKNVEIEATFLRERHRFRNPDGDVIVGDVIVGDVRDSDKRQFSIKGPIGMEEPMRDQTYRFYGRWGYYRGEEQFAFKTFVKLQPQTRAGVMRYLRKAPHIGVVAAEKLWTNYGSDAVRMLREEPLVVAEEISGLSENGAIEASEYLQENAELEKCQIDLIGLLGGHGFPLKIVDEAIRQFGNVAGDLIRKNPYILMRFRGCGFKLCDTLYLHLGKNPARLKRQALCAVHAVASESSGSTWHYVDVAKQAITASIGASQPQPEKAIRLAVRAGLLDTCFTEGQNGPRSLLGDTQWVAAASDARTERRLAKRIAMMMKEEF